MSTVIGTLFFVAILFTCVFPFWFVKIRYDAYYDKEVAAVAERDYLRHLEVIKVHATNVSRNIISVQVESDCGVAINLLRLWVNSSNYVTLNTLLEPMTTIDLGNFTAEDGLRRISLTTEKGNIFKGQPILVMEEPVPLISATVSGTNDDFGIIGIVFGAEVRLYLDDPMDEDKYLDSVFGDPWGGFIYTLNFNATEGAHFIWAKYIAVGITESLEIYINPDGTVDKL